MKMKINDHKNTYYANDIKEMDLILRKRYGDRGNDFWISHGDEEYPKLAFLVKGDLASVQYVPKKGQPLVSVGHLQGLAPGRKTTFYVPGEPIWVINEHVISLSDALKAVHEFCADPAPPKSVEWFEL